MSIEYIAKEIPLHLEIVEHDPFIDGLDLHIVQPTLENDTQLPLIPNSASA